MHIIGGENGWELLGFGLVVACLCGYVQYNSSNRAREATGEEREIQDIVLKCFNC